MLSFFVSQVWKPGVLARSQLLELQSDGSIFFSSRLLLTFRCEMDLKYFPFDVQECHLCFESCKFFQFLTISAFYYTQQLHRICFCDFGTENEFIN